MPRTQNNAAPQSRSDAPGRVPPQFPEGERAILGGCLIDSNAVPWVVEQLTPDDFYREAHRIVFRSIVDLFGRNQPVDWLTLTKELQESGNLEAVGGVPFLTDLSDCVPSAANIAHYTSAVQEKALQRSLINAGNEIVAGSYESHEDLDRWLDEAEQILFAVTERRVGNTSQPIKQLMVGAFETIETLYNRKQHITGVPSGFPDLDRLTAGFQPSDLIIVAGRPSMGKTALALNVGLNAALAGTPTAVYSLEMSKEQLALRMLCSKAGINLQALRTGYLSTEDWGRLTLAVGAISDAPLVVDDEAAQTVMQIRAKSRRIKREQGLGLIVVDYLQLMRGSRGKSEKREEEISSISRGLKALAKELNIPVIALSQLNRKCEERPNKRPQLADLRESGAIEQDADVILFIYRDEVYNKSDDNRKKGEAEIIIGKQRNGPIGVVTTSFNSRTTTFRPLTRRFDGEDGGEERNVGGDAF